MSELREQLEAFPKANLRPADYDRHAREFVHTLSQMSPARLTKDFDSPSDLLETLDPSIHSLSFLFLLLAHIHVRNEHPKSAQSVPDVVRPNGKIYEKIVVFLQNFDPVQVRYAGTEWRRLVEYLARVVRLLNVTILSLGPIRTAMIRLNPSMDTFTSIHLLYLRLCHEARAYSFALPILDYHIANFPSNSTPTGEDTFPCADHQSGSGFITYRSGLTDKIFVSDVHEYFLLGAMAYMGAGHWKQSLLYLEHVLNAPTTNVANGLMLEAYKKWLLVNCLVENGPLPLPRTINSNALKQIKTASKPYEALTEAFQSGSMSKLKAEIAAGEDLWREDGNYGLVNQLTIHLPRIFIINLQRTYAAIPVENVGKALGQPTRDVEAYLVSLINDGHLNASLESHGALSEPILRFYPDLTTGPLARSEKQNYDEIKVQIHRTNKLAEQVKHADHRMALAKEYVEFVRQQQRKENETEEATVDSWEGFEQDEDMMGDLR